jgi:hypothetical protein
VAASTAEDASGAILVFGQTGIKKKAVAAAFETEIGKVADQSGLAVADLWEAFELEDELETEVREFVRLHPERRQEQWERMAQTLAMQVNASKARRKAVFLHGFYWYRGELFNHVVLSTLAAVRPSLVVTLIDDVFDVHSRLMSREAEFKTGADKITIPELVTWRWAEIGLADLVARNLTSTPAPHFVFPVKHSAQTLRKLLLDPSPLRVYASFPISRVRRPGRLPDTQQAEMREEINAFRRDLRDRGFTVLDPLTIDEYRFDPETHTLLDRWPVEDLEPMVPAEVDLNEATLDQLKDPSVAAALSLGVEAQVEPRDFRMVAMANAVACYRPAAYDGQHSHGTLEELRYASEIGRSIVVVHDPDRDGGPYG